MTVDHRSPIIGGLHLPAGDPRATQPRAVLLELNLRFPGSRRALTRALFDTWTDFRHLPRVPDDATVPKGLSLVTSHVYQAVLSPLDVERFVAFDRAGERGRVNTVFKVWPDYVLQAHIDRSAATVQCDAARRTFAATGRGIVWAVIDSGIDASHPHFSALGLADDALRAGQPTATGAPLPAGGPPPSPTYDLHRDFTYLVKVGLDPEGDEQVATDSPLTDDDGHGTHVAGIIAGRCPDGVVPHVASPDEPIGDEGFVSRTPSAVLAGMAPECQLVSLKVLRRNAQGLLVTSSAAVLRALDYIRTEVNADTSLLRIHGVNLSLGCDWDPAHYAAGRSPLCQAIEELVSTGVFVVVSAGNGGQVRAANPNDTVSLLGSITEPAHAEACIAVGSTHREAPYAFGVTYTSGKGPTLDGRYKPDVVAPGEWITSAATGALRHRTGLASLPAGTAEPTLTYAPDSGTSMAAPHVSGVLAAFLSAKTEFIGETEKVKTILCENATDLGRERYAQGRGLVDLLRMLSNT